MENKITPSQLTWSEGKVKGFSGKELISLANGSLKLVKIAANSVYPIHVHPTKTEYTFILKGKPSFTIEGEDFEGKEGEFIVFPQNKKHGIQNNTNSECQILVGAIEY
ncbi:MAG: quercetin dioxygenase-like cupin family protein [Sphingobacteriales bacterium]|jgi:quercetin dioxygenase-like cupin family protein